MRQVHIDEDLSGQVLVASGPNQARESLFLRCNLTGAQFVGDWRGTDFLTCNLTNANLTGAQLYAAMWRDCTLTGAQLPADIGFLHHEPIAEIIRQRAQMIVAQADAKSVIDMVRADMTDAPEAVPIAGGLPRYFQSWDTLGKASIEDGTAERNARVLAAWRALWAPYPNLAARWTQLENDLAGRTVLYDGTPPKVATCYWDDGASVEIDEDNLPALAEPSRFALRRHVEALADAQRPGPHFAFIFSLGPLFASRIESEDGWLGRARGF